MTGAWCALAAVFMIFVDIGRYLVWPPPRSTAGFFDLLLENPALGLISLDLLFIASNTLSYMIYFALAVVLWRVNRSAVVIALAFGVVGTAAFMSSTRPVEMLLLAHEYADADAAGRTALLAIGDGMLATWTGTGYVVYCYFGFATLLILSVLMLRSSIFSRATGVWGLVGAGLMAVPASFGQVGLAFAVMSLAPWSVFALLVGRRLLQLADPAGPAVTAEGLREASGRLRPRAPTVTPGPGVERVPLHRTSRGARPVRGRHGEVRRGDHVCDATLTTRPDESR